MSDTFTNYQNSVSFGFKKTLSGDMAQLVKARLTTKNNQKDFNEKKHILLDLFADEKFIMSINTIYKVYNQKYFNKNHKVLDLFADETVSALAIIACYSINCLKGRI